ncbi:unnamed protein product [Acanthoscelides obtectus]|uniref:Uncharacterized protein n=1 Tax=Acanthoscelides obtectus TaxID=200917 RepID=A0A9P0JQ37_ACAOB|nr:unnamed protein product [Acanthoscelides obtectus]CAK1658131.1 hypothetical protein AOBTE_LOCUS20712 [Acanthoscelides obtectus]
MKAALAVLAVCLLSQGANAWGGLFNRFSPEMLANMGYGGHGGGGGGGVFLACYGRQCTANENCCPGSVCVDWLAHVSLHMAEGWARYVDEIVIVNLDWPPVRQEKQYAEPCHMSAECDISRGLCCQLQRRHRQAPRKIPWSA